MPSVLLGENPLRGVSPSLRGFRNNINPWQAGCSDSNGSGWPPAWGHCRTCARAKLDFLKKKKKKNSVVHGVVDSDYIGEISFDLAAYQNCKLIKVKE